MSDTTKKALHPSRCASNGRCTCHKAGWPIGRRHACCWRRCAQRPASHAWSARKEATTRCSLRSSRRRCLPGPGLLTPAGAPATRRLRRRQRRGRQLLAYQLPAPSAAAERARRRRAARAAPPAPLGRGRAGGARAPCGARLAAASREPAPSVRPLARPLKPQRCCTAHSCTALATACMPFFCAGLTIRKPTPRRPLRCRTSCHGPASASHWWVRGASAATESPPPLRSFAPARRAPALRVSPWRRADARAWCAAAVFPIAGWRGLPRRDDGPRVAQGAQQPRDPQPGDLTHRPRGMRAATGRASWAGYGWAADTRKVQSESGLQLTARSSPGCRVAVPFVGRQTRHLASCSGSSWLAGAYAFQSKYSAADFLGPYLKPQVIVFVCVGGAGGSVRARAHALERTNAYGAGRVPARSAVVHITTLCCASRRPLRSTAAAQQLRSVLAAS